LIIEILWEYGKNIDFHPTSCTLIYFLFFSYATINGESLMLKDVLKELIYECSIKMSTGNFLQKRMNLKLGIFHSCKKCFGINLPKGFVKVSSQAKYPFCSIN